MSVNPFADLMNRASSELRPLTAQLELTYKCNWLCSFCYNSPKEKAELTGDQWLIVLDKLRAAGTFNVTLTGGEPFLHRDFFRIAEGVRDRGLVLKVYTNGQLLADRERAERYADTGPFTTEISLHGADAATHERLTGVRGSFDKLLAGLQNLSDLGLKVTLKTPITRLNQAQLRDIERIGERFGYLVTFDTNITPTDDGDLGPLSLGADKDFMVAFIKDQVQRGRRGLNPRDMDKVGTNCSTGRTTLTVDPYGDLFPCVAWRRRIANMLEVEDLLALWQGKAGTNETLDYVRKVASEVPSQTLAPNPEGAFASFCPAVAEKETGSAYAFYTSSRVSGLVKLQAFSDLAREKEAGERAEGPDRGLAGTA